MAESERMRHRLDLLQMKISSLNVARMSGLPPPATMYSADPMFCGGEKEQLTSELQLIENSIQVQGSTSMYWESGNNIPKRGKMTNEHKVCKN
jgi:hypothetical protein